MKALLQFSSVQFSHSVVSDSLQPHGLQHTRPPCPSPTPETAQTHDHRGGDAIQPSHPVIPFSCLQSFPESGSFQMSLFFATPWTAAHQASLSITSSRSLLKLMSTESMMPSNHLILCCPLLLLPSIFPSITIFSNESALCISWQKYWGFSFNISPSKDYSGLISSGMDW